MFSSSSVVYDVSISWNYILLSVTDNFGLRKWAEIERNDRKLIWVRTSPVDWRVYAREQWVSKPILQNRMRSLIYLLKLQGMTACSTVFPSISTSSDKRRKLKRKVIFNSYLFFSTFSLLSIVVSRLSSGWKYTVYFWDFFCYFIR